MSDNKNLNDARLEELEELDDEQLEKVSGGKKYAVSSETVIGFDNIIKSES